MRPGGPANPRFHRRGLRGPGAQARGVMIGRFSVSEHFACHVPAAHVAAWGACMKHIRGPVELYGILVLNCLWHNQCSGKPCIFFVDNDAAVDACVNGTFGPPAFAQLVPCLEPAELFGQWYCWFSRVPSRSNPACETSRGKLYGFLEDLKAVRVSAPRPRRSPAAGFVMAHHWADVKLGLKKGPAVAEEGDQARSPAAKRRVKLLRFKHDMLESMESYDLR